MEAKECSQSEARGENRAKQEYLLMKDEKAKLYIAIGELTCLRVHSNSLCDLHDYFYGYHTEMCKAFKNYLSC